MLGAFPRLAIATQRDRSEKARFLDQRALFLKCFAGIPGLMARSVIDTNDGTPPPKGDNWHPSPTMKGWWWNGDTSSGIILVFVK